MISRIVDTKNLEDQREKGEEWKDTDLEAFPACLVPATALKPNSISAEPLLSPVDRNPLVRATFVFRIFSSFLNHLRLDDKATRFERR